MKTFESQLLELLREYEDDWFRYERADISTATLYSFTDWLSKRVEKEEEKTKKAKLIALCDKYSQSGFLDNVRDNKEEFINAILDL